MHNFKVVSFSCALEHLAASESGRLAATRLSSLWSRKLVSPPTSHTQHPHPHTKRTALTLLSMPLNFHYFLTFHIKSNLLQCAITIYFQKPERRPRVHVRLCKQKIVNNEPTQLCRVNGTCSDKVFCLIKSGNTSSIWSSHTNDWNQDSMVLFPGVDRYCFFQADIDY